MMSEAGVAIGSCGSQKVLLKLFYDFLVIDLWQVLIRENLAHVREGAERTWSVVKHPIVALAEVIKALKTKAGELLALVRSGNIEAIGILLLRLIVSVALHALGFWTGTAVPDIDLLAAKGIGAHRCIWSHSALPILFAEVLKLFVLRVGKSFYENLPKVHHFLWDELAIEGARALHLLVGGFQAGVIAHLLKDAFWDGSQNLRDLDGNSLISKKNIITKDANFIYSREVTSADVFLFGNAAGPVLAAVGKRRQRFRPSF